MKQYLIVLALALPIPTMTFAKDASCIAVGFKATDDHYPRMNKEAQSMKRLVPALLNETFGNIKFCAHSDIEKTFTISDGYRVISQDLITRNTSFYSRGTSLKPSKCLNKNYQPYSPKQGKC